MSNIGTNTPKDQINLRTFVATSPKVVIACMTAPSSGLKVKFDFYAIYNCTVIIDLFSDS